jgi:hypothetical protein
MTNPLAVAAREATLTLYPGDTQVRLDELQRQIAEAVTAATKGPQRLAGKPVAEELLSEHEALIEATKDRAVTLRLRGVSNTVVGELQETHPPRKGNRVDEMLGGEERPFLQALLRACLVEPKVTAAEFEEAVADWSETNWRLATHTAYELSAGSPVALPKESLRSLLPGLRATASTLLDVQG